MGTKDRDFILRELFSKLSIKEEELIRPIVPVEKWVTDEYYVGKDGLKLYPFWRGVIKDIFESGSQYNQVVLDGGLGCTPCYIRKRTSLGYLNLTEIKDQLPKGNSVFVKTENGVESIKDVHFIGKQKTKIIHFNDGSSYECTHNHLFRTLTKDGEIQWVRADQLSPQDHILRSAHSGMFPDTNQCVEGKYAYTVGYYIGDGDYDKSNNSFRIVYGDHKYSTESYLYVYTQLLDLSKTHHVSVYESYNKCKSVLTGQTSRRFTIYTCSHKELFLSCGLNAKEKHIPDYVNLFTKEETCLLLAGLFDSDGCVEYDNRTNHISVSFSSRNKILVYQIQTILHNLGIHSVVKIQDRLHSNKGVDYRLRIQDFYSIQKFYTLIPLKVEYKKELLGTYIQCIVSQKEYNKTSKSLKIKNLFTTLYTFCKDHSIVKQVNIPKCRPLDGISLGKLHYIKYDLDTPLSESPTLDYLYNNQCYSALIDSIEDSEAECGDIEVEGSHTYISDGIINHNTGKSTCGVFIMLRKLYEISCYKSIQGKFHLMDSALIVFLYFSLSKFQAKRTGFKQFKDTVDSIPYFTENFPRDIKANDELRFPSNVYYLYGTGTGDAIGSNMLCSLIDEGNFFGNSSGDSTDYSEVADLHRALVARQASRFLRNGKNESLSIVISSNTYKSSYTEELRKRALTDPSIKCYRARSWDVKPKGTFSDQYFYVFCGTDKVDPFIIEEPFDLISKLNLRLDPNQTVKEAINKLPIDLRNLVDEVPEDLREHYVVNIVKALQDFSGFSVESTNTLFNNRNVFNACIDNSVPSLFTKTEFVIETMNDQPQNTIMYYLSGRPFPHPDRPRFLHVDLGLSTDACGIACCYQSGVKMVDGIERPTYSFDFSIRIVPPPAPKKISISRTEEFLIYLRDKLHLQIGMISWDQFQCLHGDTLIYTTKGNIPIKEVKVGDFVINDSGECRVNNVFHYIDADLIKVTTKRGKELLGTPNHRIRISRKWDYTKVWCGHKWSPQKFKVRQTPKWEWICLSDIKQGDIIDTDYIVYDSCNHIFEDIKKERDIAYLVGYYLGNGTLGINKVHGVSFTTGTEEYADKIKNLLDTYFVGHNNKIYKKVQPTTGYSVQAPYKEISDFFYSLGFCKERSDTKIIPDLVKGLSNNFLLGLLCGYIDADGTTVNHQINCSSTSIQLLEDFKFILEYRLGLRGFISKVRDACKMEVLGKLCNAKTSYHLGITGNVESLDIGISIKLKGVKNYRPYFDKVLSVEPYGKADVYDLSVDKEQAYIANGIYSHNSSSSQQRLQELGFPVRYQSVDRTDKAYLYFVENLYLNCVTFNAQFADDIQHELFNLIHDRKKGKVDHPSDTAHGGMKDRMDAVVGSMYNAFECKPPEVNYNDTYALSYLNSDQNNAHFTEDSAWLFETGSVNSQVKEILDQEMQAMLKERY